VAVLHLMVSEIWLFIEGSTYHVTTSGCIDIEVYIIPQLGLVLSKLELLFYYFLFYSTDTWWISDI
jgi:hypothetical protein